MKWNLYPISDFASWSADWDKLNTEAGSSQLLSKDFVGVAVDIFAPIEARLGVCQTNDKIVAMTVLSSEKPAVWNTLQPSQAPIGFWLQNPECDTEALISSLIPELPPITLAVGITQQDPNLLARPDDTGTLSSLDYIQTARISCQGDFDTYLSQRSKNHRQNLKRQRNKLERENVATRLEIITDCAMVESCITDYGRLESAGWKNNTDTAIQIANDQGRFYKTLLETLMKKNNAVIYRYWYGDHLVATDLGVFANGTLIILKTTYDESIKTSSPAVLMHQDIFKDAFESDKINSIEFYGSVMDWHRKWTEDIRTMYHLNYYSWPALLAKKAMNITKPVRNLLRI